MAISFKSDKDYGYSLLPLFGVAADIVSHAKACGVQVDQSSPGMFVIKCNETVYGSVSVKGSAISLAKSKTLGPASKEALKYQFEAALNKAIAANALGVPSTIEVEVVPHAPIKAANILKPAPKAAKSTSAKFDKSSPVPLKDATSAYQAVTGTTHGSVYFVLAIADGLNVAARIQGQKLSLRAEGDKLPSYLPALGDMGMDSKPGYASGHYDVSSMALMIKTLGATLGTVGFGAIKDLADLKTFVGGQ